MSCQQIPLDLWLNSTDELTGPRVYDEQFACLMCIWECWYIWTVWESGNADGSVYVTQWPAPRSTLSTLYKSQPSVFPLCSQIMLSELIMPLSPSALWNSGIPHIVGHWYPLGWRRKRCPHPTPAHLIPIYPLAPMSVCTGQTAAPIDLNIKALHHHHAPTQSASEIPQYTPSSSPRPHPPHTLVLIAADVIPQIFSQIRGLKLWGRLASLWLAMLCHPDGSLIPNIKVWLLARVLSDSVASIQTHLLPPAGMKWQKVESKLRQPWGVGVRGLRRVVTNHQMIEKSFERAS